MFAAGRVGFQGKYRLHCVVHNISEGGAKLVFLNTVGLPSTIIVRIGLRGVEEQYLARVRWQNKSSVGIEFMPEVPMELKNLEGVATARRMTYSRPTYEKRAAK